MIESAVWESGLRIHGAQSAKRPEAVIFDADPWNPDRAVALRAIRAADSEARIVAAAGFPRPDLTTALRESGADDVWFKLAPLDELVEMIHQERAVTGSNN